MVPKPAQLLALDQARLAERGRGLRVEAAVSSEEKRMASSLCAAISELTSSSCARNMFSDRRMCTPLSQTSAIVASPSSSSHSASPSARGLLWKRVRYHQSDASKSWRPSQSQAFAARKALATVPGQSAFDHSSGAASTSQGDAGRLPAPDFTSLSCQPASSGSTP